MKLKLNTTLCLTILCVSISLSQNNMDNPELKKLYKEDQADRKTEKVDWKLISERDSLRRKRVYELLKSDKVKTANDYSNAAMIFQHGKDSIAFGMAVKLMKKAVSLDATISKWLLAAAIDRELMSRDQPQIYGTQFVRKGKEDPWELYTIDTTKISDEERIAHKVETLARLKERVKLLNKKPISEVLETGISIEEFISFCRREKTQKEESKYNLTEIAINNYGYELMKKDKNKEALALFKLNVELYPNAFNTYDSLGECLLKLDETEEGLSAYRKSLALNPDNKNAEKIIKKYQNPGTQY
ncbi:tetratricopeptide repeat protein [Aquimarina sp. AU58]|uniref:tetratricopeptide repeat protein n=1 Tax=Aquimarina sp. AU58 TaxID=1874112 RepID=UPI000D6E5250|nr:tetratricopeptide repeat protein [Aquimarina sp. AU58]